MKLRILLIGIAVSAASLFAQNKLVGELKKNYDMTKDFAIRGAEKMPDANYAFKPTPEVRSLGQVLAHVADAQNNFCSGVLGQPNPSPNVEKTKTTKAEIVEALKASGAVCTKAYAMSDEDSHAKMKLFGREMPKFTALVVNLSHDWEHYGNLITYMRLKGMTPPSSQPRPATK